jgi:hypothetical protein
MSNRGVPITYVSKQLGHAKPTTTLQWYAHALPTATAHYVDQIDGGEVGKPVPCSPLAPTHGTPAVSEATPPIGSVEILEMTSGPARNRTANPLIKRAAQGATRVGTCPQRRVLSASC